MPDDLTQDAIDRLLSGDSAASGRNGVAIVARQDDVNRVTRLMNRAGATTTSAPSLERNTWDAARDAVTNRDVDFALIDLTLERLPEAIAQPPGTLIADLVSKLGALKRQTASTGSNRR
jgi:hypothetical protein